MKTTDALLLIIIAATLSTAHAQGGKWPDKPVRAVVPMAPGGNGDITARMIAARLFDEFGQQFIIDNRPGAGGSIGAGIVVHANPDGYTMIVMSSRPACAILAAAADPTLPAPIIVIIDLIL